jgi:fibronectin-binding autotransporter adhesin
MQRIRNGKLTIIMTCWVLCLAGIAQAGVIQKANNTDNLNLTTSWVGGSGPGSGDIALWTNIVTAANTVTLGAAQSWAGVRLNGQTGNVVFNSGSTLTLGSSGITNVSAGTFTMNNRIDLGAAQTWYSSSKAIILGNTVYAMNKTLDLAGAGSVLIGASGLTGFTGTLNVAVASLNMTAGASAGGSHDGVLYNLAAGSMLYTKGTATGPMTMGSVEGAAGSKMGGNTTQITANTFKVGGANVDATFAGIITNGGAGGVNSIEKAGTARWTLSGTNYYSGTTLVSGGSLIIDGDNSGATGTVTVAAGAILGGSGTIGGATTVNGTLNPGNSPGTLTFNEALTLGSTSTSRFEIVSAVSFDVLKNDNTGTDAITFNSGANVIFDFTGNTTLTNGSTFAVLQGWESIETNGAVFSTVGLSGMSLDLSSFKTLGLVTVIPEPATIGMLGLGALVTLMIRRMRTADC